MAAPSGIFCLLIGANQTVLDNKPVKVRDIGGRIKDVADLKLAAKAEHSKLEDVEQDKLTIWRPTQTDALKRMDNEDLPEYISELDFSDEDHITELDATTELEALGLSNGEILLVEVKGMNRLSFACRRSTDSRIIISISSAISAD